MQLKMELCKLCLVLVLVISGSNFGSALQEDEKDNTVEDVPIEPVINHDDEKNSTEISLQKTDDECMTVFENEDTVVNCISKNLMAVPENMDNNVTSLDLKDNIFNELSMLSVPMKMKNLTKLSLANNQISSIDKAVFENIPNVEVIDLTGNLLKTISDAFTEATNLKELNLFNNAELSLSGEIPTMNNLLKLNLSDCKLNELPEKVFENLTSLEELDLGLNDAGLITKDLFVPLIHLKKLTLPKMVSDESILEICNATVVLEIICLDNCNTDTDFTCRSGGNLSEVDHPIVDLSNETTTTTVTNISDETVSEILPDSDLLLPIDGGKKVIEDQEPLDVEPVEDTLEKEEDKLAKKTNPEDTVPETSRAGVSTRGANGTAVGIIIGIIVVMGVGIIVKKNWSTIKKKWQSRNGRAPPPSSSRARPTERKSDMPKPSPEEMPLRGVNSEDNPV